MKKLNKPWKVKTKRLFIVDVHVKNEEKHIYKCMWNEGVKIKINLMICVRMYICIDILVYIWK